MSYEDNNIISPDILTDGEGNTFEETVMEEEIEINQKIHIIKKESNLDIFDERTEYEVEKTSPTKNSESVLIGIKQEWAAEAEVAARSLDEIDSEDERTEFVIEKTEGDEEEEDEEETIAMFVTASGQQLALYAVEDSDDYFAVAVYDESGEPPSNFQFLMKSDVERLIREGAVRTVKKPTQIKRQLVTTQPPVFIPKEEITGDVIKKPEIPIEPIKHRIVDNKKTKATPNFVKPVIESQPKSKIIRLDDSGSEEELVEQSTVQYILCDGDQSDTELTFDEIQATLQEFKTSDSRKHYKNIPIEKPSAQKKTNNGLVYLASPSTICNPSYRGSYYPNSIKIEPSPKPQSPVKRSHISNTSIIGSKQNHGIKRELSPMSDYYTPNTSVNISLSDSITNTNSQLKVKRPRKQQLTSVNREDTEIIIQPASMLEEEEEIPMPRKRGKRKKKNAKISKLPTRKSTRRRRTRVEIIDIDVDDSDSDEPPRRKEILEITLDENKEKGSSDKENEIIMVGDSDEDDEDDDDNEDDDIDEDEENDDYEYDDESNTLKCKHCLKIFKYTRTFDSHKRVCSKYRGRSHRLSDRYMEDESSTDDESPREKKMTKKNSKDKSSKPKKEYTCKTCEEKFDMVVTLARHVRAEHTPRKRGRPSKADAKKLQMQIEINRIKNLERKNADEKLRYKMKKNVYDDDDDNDDDDVDEDDVESEKEVDELEKVLEELERDVEEVIVPKKLESEKEQVHKEVEAEEVKEKEKEKATEKVKEKVKEKEKEKATEKKATEKVKEKEKEKATEKVKEKEEEKEVNEEKEENDEKKENPPRIDESTEQTSEPNTTEQLSTVSQSKLARLANKRKLIARLHRKWKFADLICTICNRWLPSASAHENHILQHFTKRRIARDIYECPICHKFFKSQLMYMKHKKLHTKVERNFKSEESRNLMNLQDKGSRLSAIRRCGRPRKF
ncbi:kinetochore protein SLK19-like [Leptopilina heterotoma]|uniref:kinetochore protein SLK19-like n=1 Tax=Leptopilina heterotoma TaxID=63436 RepID=UPI001CA7C2CC|nr:kinetochore protein SLK19-like [Leptopilina heterotoma]